MKNLKEMNQEELINLKKEIENEMLRRGEDKKEYTFIFEATNDPRKGTPYVAKLKWIDGKVEREFCNMQKIYGKKEVTISGKYVAKEGEIVEIRTGGSWKNDYRAWYLIHDDQEKLVADIDDTKKRARITSYLQGLMTLDEILSDIKQKEDKWNNQMKEMECIK